MALLLVPCFAQGFRQTAIAAAESFTVDRTIDAGYAVNGSCKYTTTVDGKTHVVYCNDPYAPGGPDGTFAIADGTPGTDRQNYLMAKGYPNSTTLAGSSLSADDAQAVTQIAMWMDDDPDLSYSHVSHLSTEFGQEAPARSLYDTAKRFFQQANAYAGGDSSIDGAAATYTADRSGSQRIITVNLTPMGSLEIVKSSADESVTGGNSCYSLKGAKFEVKDSSGKVAGTVTTDAQGEGSLGALPVGTYTVKETAAPAGYLVAGDAKSVTVQAGATAQVRFSDRPLVDTRNTRVSKVDATTRASRAQGSAGLAGAEFTFRFYAGYYSNLAELPSRPTRTWVMKSDATGEAKPFGGTPAKASGDGFYTAADGSVVVPLGTVAVTETAAPGGYLLDDGEGNPPRTYLAQIVQSGEGTAVKPINYNGESVLRTHNTPIAADTVMRGNLELTKADSAARDGKAQGGATLAGARFEVVNMSAQPVVSPQTGSEVAHGAVVCTIVTGEDGRASTSDADLNGWSVPAGWGGKALAYGTYQVREVQPPEGYLPNTAWTATVTVDNDGQVVVCDPADDVKRGDFEFGKVDGTTMKRLGGIPFSVTSKSTGEAHVLVSDENGMVSTSATWNAHSASTNANDAALAGDGSVSEAALDPSAGIWFFGHADEQAGAPVDDALGALPYDTYTVAELRCSANEGLTLASFEVTVSRHGTTLNLGTVDDNPGPSIGTLLTDAQGTKTVPATGTCVLTDEIAYANFQPGEYTFEGELHQLGTDGEDAGVVATGSKTVRLTSAQGSVEVSFEVDARDLAGGTLVAFESCFDADGAVVAVHEDPEDDFQTVSVPAIGTTLVDGADGDHEAGGAEQVTLVDTVAYEGLTPGRAYTMTMTLHRVADDGTDAGPLLDANGDEVVAEEQFVPTNPDGMVQVAVTFAPAPGTYDTVAFEELRHGGTLYALHADIADKGQTVRITEKPQQQDSPWLATSAADVKTGTREGEPADLVTIVDKVAVSGLEAGARYVVSGVLYDRDTGEPYLDAQGKQVTGSAEIVASGERETAEVAFKLEGSDLSGKSLVAFERLASADAPDKPLAVHEDLANKAQTVTFKGAPASPKATTKASSPLPRTGDALTTWVPAVAALATASAAAAAVALAIRRRRNRA